MPKKTREFRPERIQKALAESDRLFGISLELFAQADSATPGCTSFEDVLDVVFDYRDEDADGEL